MKLFHTLNIVLILFITLVGVVDARMFSPGVAETIIRRGLQELARTKTVKNLIEFKQAYQDLSPAQKENYIDDYQDVIKTVERSYPVPYVPNKPNELNQYSKNMLENIKKETEQKEQLKKDTEKQNQKLLEKDPQVFVKIEEELSEEEKQNKLKNEEERKKQEELEKKEEEQKRKQAEKKKEEEQKKIEQEQKKIEQERLEKERLEKAKLEKERLEKERLEKERLEKERLEKERLEQERLEKERLGKERLERERLEKEKLEKERLEKERLEKERLEKERLEKERLEKERLEKERLEKERLKKQQEEQNKRSIIVHNKSSDDIVVAIYNYISKKLQRTEAQKTVKTGQDIELSYDVRSCKEPYLVLDYDKEALQPVIQLAPPKFKEKQEEKRLLSIKDKKEHTVYDLYKDGSIIIIYPKNTKQKVVFSYFNNKENKIGNLEPEITLGKVDQQIKLPIFKENFTRFAGLICDGNLLAEGVNIDLFKKEQQDKNLPILVHIKNNKSMSTVQGQNAFNVEISLDFGETWNKVEPKKEEIKQNKEDIKDLPPLEDEDDDMNKMSEDDNDDSMSRVSIDINRLKEECKKCNSGGVIVHNKSGENIKAAFYNKNRVMSNELTKVDKNDPIAVNKDVIMVICLQNFKKININITPYIIFLKENTKVDLRYDLDRDTNNKIIQPFSILDYKDGNKIIEVKEFK